MIVWSGWGILVLLVALVGFALGIPLGAVVSGGDVHLGAMFGFIIGGLLSGVGIFFLARALEGGTVRSYTDNLTGQVVVVRRSAGSLFFIPTRYWAFIVPVLGIAMGVFAKDEKLDAKDDAVPAAVTPTAAPVPPTSRDPADILMTDAGGKPLPQGEVHELTPEEARQVEEILKRAKR